MREQRSRTASKRKPTAGCGKICRPPMMQPDHIWFAGDCSADIATSETECIDWVMLIVGEM